MNFKEFKIDDKPVTFLRNLGSNPNPEIFTDDDALCLATCPNLLEAMKKAEENPNTEIPCQKCRIVSVKLNRYSTTFEITGKCPKK